MSERRASTARSSSTTTRTRATTGRSRTPDARAEGQNPLCGDEVTVSVRFAADGETIEDIGFEGRGCAISQAATSMLTEIVKGRTAAQVAALPKEELLEEIGIPLTPIRLKCAILGLGVLKVALHGRRARRCRTSGRASTLADLDVGARSRSCRRAR